VRQNRHPVGRVTTNDWDIVLSSGMRIAYAGLMRVVGECEDGTMARRLHDAEC